MEGNLQLGHLRPYQFHQMSRQHIIFGLNFRPYTIYDNMKPQVKARGMIRNHM